MSGRLEEFRLEDVLQAIGSSPQCTAIELRAADGDLRGTIWIERGRVLGAEHGGERGRDAFCQLFGATAADLFVVSRLRDAVPAADPLGSVTALLLEALERVGPRPRASTAPLAPPPDALAKGSQIIPLPQPAPPSTRPAFNDGDWDECTVARPVRRGGVAVAIASARGGVGRSTIARHLSWALARAGHRVILVDFDGGETRAAAAPTLDELLVEVDTIDEALREARPGLRLLPIAAPPPSRHSIASEWLALLPRVRARADVVVVDCPPGLTGIPGEVVAACTHVVGVVRSDRGASTSATALEGRIDALAADRGPQLAGIIVNLFDGRSVPSIDAFGRIASHGVPMFETTIPRADVLADDSDDEPGALSWLFDALAAEVSARSGLDEQAPAVTLTAATAGLSWLPR